MSFVYISYGTLDEELARTVQFQLEDAGFTTWLDDVRELDETLVSVITSAISSAGAFVAIGGAGLGYPDIVKWEIGVASRSGIPILSVRSVADIPAVTANLENLIDKPPSLIPLPMPMRWEPDPPSHSRRVGRIGWFVLLSAVSLGVLWLIRLAFLTPAEPTVEITLTPPGITASPAEVIIATETSLPVIIPPATLPPSPPPSAPPSATPAPSATTTPTITPSITPSLTLTPTPTATASPTATQTATSTPTNSATPTRTPSQTPSPTATATATPTGTPTPTTWPTAAPGEKWLTNTPAP